MALMEAITWVASAIFTTAVSGAGFYCLAVAADYVKGYYREQRQRERERLSQEFLEIKAYHEWKEGRIGGIESRSVGGLVNRRHDSQLSRGASIFSAYKMSPAFLSCTAKPRGRLGRSQSASQCQGHPRMLDYTGSTRGSSDCSTCSSSCCCCCSSTQLFLQRHFPLVAASRTFTLTSSMLDLSKTKKSESDELCSRCKMNNKDAASSYTTACDNCDNDNSDDAKQDGASRRRLGDNLLNKKDEEVISPPLCTSVVRPPISQYRQNYGNDVSLYIPSVSTNTLLQSSMGNNEHLRDRVQNTFYQEMLMRATKEFPFIVPFLKHDSVIRVGNRGTQTQVWDDEDVGVNVHEEFSKPQPTSVKKNEESQTNFSDQELPSRCVSESLPDNSSPTKSKGDNKTPAKTNRISPQRTNGMRSVFSSFSPTKNCVPPARQSPVKTEHQSGNIRRPSPRKRIDSRPVCDVRNPNGSPSKKERIFGRSSGQKEQLNRRAINSFGVETKTIPEKAVELLDIERNDEKATTVHSDINPSIELATGLKSNGCYPREFRLQNACQLNSNEQFKGKKWNGNSNEPHTSRFTPPFDFNTAGKDIASSGRCVSPDVGKKWKESENKLDQSDKTDRDCSRTPLLSVMGTGCDNVIPLEDLIKIQEEMIAMAARSREPQTTSQESGDDDNKKKKPANPLRKMSTRASRLREVSSLRKDLHSKSPEKREVTFPGSQQSKSVQKKRRKFPIVSPSLVNTSQPKIRDCNLERGSQITIAKSLQVELKERTLLKSAKLIPQTQKLKLLKFDSCGDTKSLKAPSRTKRDLKSSSNFKRMEHSSKNQKSSSTKLSTAKPTQSVLTLKSVDSKNSTGRRKQKTVTTRNTPKQKGKSQKTVSGVTDGDGVSKNPAIESSKNVQETGSQESDNTVRGLLRKSVLDDVVSQLNIGSNSSLLKMTSSESETSSTNQNVELSNVAISIVNKYAINISSVNQNVMSGSGVAPSTDNLNRVFGEHASFPLQDFASLVTGED